MVARLPIVNDHRAILIDADLYPILRRFRWRVPRSQPEQAQRPYTVVGRGRHRKHVRLARLITKAGRYAFPQHRNRNPLDCRRANLKLVTTTGEAGWVTPAELELMPGDDGLLALS